MADEKDKTIKCLACGANWLQKTLGMADEKDDLEDCPQCKPEKYFLLSAFALLYGYYLLPIRASTPPPPTFTLFTIVDNKMIHSKIGGE